MKKTVLFLAALCAMHSALLAATVPATFNYQGKVSDGTNTLIGSGTSTNRKMLFRFYSSSTGGDVLWAEQQTVTIYNGEFSVLLGTGLSYVDSGVTQPHASIDTVFTGVETQLYLEITVAADSTNVLSTATPISPRQAIATTAFAFRAQTADRINSNSSLQLGSSSSSGLGYYDNSRQFNSTNVNGPVLYGANGGVLGSVNSGVQRSALSWNSLGNVGVGCAGSGNTDGSLALSVAGAADQMWVTDPGKGGLGIGYQGTGSYGRLQAWNGSWSPTPLVLQPHGSGVGIGKSSISYTLDVAGSIAAGGGNGYLFNTGDTDGGMFSPSDGVLVWKTNAAERMRLDGYGNLGIGTTAPTAKIDVEGYVKLRTSTGRNHFKDVEKSDGTGLRVGAAWNMYGIYAEGTEKCAVGGGAGVVLQRVNPDGAGEYSSLEVGTSGKISIGGAPMDSKLNIRDGEILFEDRGQNGPSYGVRGNVSSDFWHIFGNAGTANNMALYIDSGDDGNEEIIFRQCVGGTANWRMKINSDGNVVVNDGMLAGGFRSTGSRGYSFTSGDTDGGMFSNSDGNLSFKTDNAERAWISSSGFSATNITANTKLWANSIWSNWIGVGTDTPDCPLQVSRWTDMNLYVRRYMNASTDANWNSNTVGAVSIHAGDRVITDAEFNVVSDSRIKTDLKVTDSAKDLGTLCAIEITDYHLKDTIAGDAKPYKKVIAQQVETVYPQAVNRGVGVVPDIYKKAAIEDGWVKLATDLKVGEQVSLIDEKGKAVHKVLAVREGAFQVEATPAGKEVFVYGREVKDFRSMDYDAIAMLNVSATQELVKQLKEKDAKIAALEEKLADQVKQDSVRDAKLSAIEKKLFGGAGGPETVSLKTGE